MENVFLFPGWAKIVNFFSTKRKYINSHDVFFWKSELYYSRTKKSFFFQICSKFIGEEKSTFKEKGNDSKENKTTNAKKLLDTATRQFFIKKKCRWKEGKELKIYRQNTPEFFEVTKYTVISQRKEPNLE